MRKFEKIEVDLSKLRKEINEFSDLLLSNAQLKEREHVAPFFKRRKQLSAAIGLLNGQMGLADLVAVELSLFGDFVVDVASGDSSANAFTLVEFEDAKPYSIYQEGRGRAVRKWSQRFEQGYSQIVDWAWRLDGERESDAFRRIFLGNVARIDFLVVVGRDADLRDGDLARLRWRTQNVSLGNHRMICCTFDQLLSHLRRRMLYWEGVKEAGVQEHGKRNTITQSL